VNQRVDNDDTPLIIAARENLLDIVKTLLRNGADITLSDCEMENALHNACHIARRGVITTLLDAGININDTQCEGYSPLHLALINHNTEATLCLLEHNPDVDMVCNGQTPISLACESGYYGAVEALLSKNVNVNPESDNRPLTPDPLSISAWKGSLQIAQTLIQSKAIVNSQNSEGQTPLFQATKQGHCKMMKLLIDNKARVNIQDRYGNTCLHLSVCNHKSDDMLLLLLKKEAAVNVCNKDGTTVLMMAIEGKQGVSDKRIRAIIEHGANVNAHDKFGKTALHRAAEFGLESVIETLLRNEANVNACNQDGESALFIAAKNGRANAVHLLLQNNAGAKVLSNSGESPLDVAKRMEFHNIVNFLQEFFQTTNADRRDSSNLVDAKKDSIMSNERKIVMVKSNPLGPVLPRKRSPYKIPVRR
jgi:serine/threonine-protein phosphatase 6 regulatory ankyrin repeat subunit B